MVKYGYSGKIWMALEFSGLNSSFQGLKFVGWWGMTPMREMMKKETWTWNEMDRTLDSVGNGYRLHSGKSKWMDRR